MANGNNVSQETVAEVDILVNCKLAELREELAKQKRDDDLRLMTDMTNADNRVSGLENRINQLKGEIVALRAEILDA